MKSTVSVHAFLSYIFVPSVLMSILYKNIVKISDMRKYFFISFLTGIVLSTGSYLIILPLLSIITIVQLNADENKIKILITIYAIYFANTIYTFIYTFYGGKLQNIPFGAILIQFMIMSCIIIMVSLIINKISSMKRVQRKSSSSQIRLKMILIINIPLTVIIYGIFLLTYPSPIGKEKMDFIVGNFIPEALPLISIILTSIIVYNHDKSVEYRVRLKREIEEKHEIEEYSRIVENMYAETRKFKHDYINMLLPLKEYIDNNDNEALREFFYSNVIDIDKDIKWSDSNIDKLKYVKILGLKALLSTKLIKAASMSIDIKVDIVEDIQYISMNIMDLCRIIGILMDNAIEAAEPCEHPKIYICVVNKNGYVIIALQNNFSGEKPVIYKIYKEGFSTKGSGRGLGLYTVKSIIDKKYDNVFLNTSIEESMFIQELWIKNM